MKAELRKSVCLHDGYPMTVRDDGAWGWLYRSEPVCAGEPENLCATPSLDLVARGGDMFWESECVSS